MISCLHSYSLSFFFFNDTATTEIYTLSLHDALPISRRKRAASPAHWPACRAARRCRRLARRRQRAQSTARRPRRRCAIRSEEHTSELQSRLHLVCRLLLEKKKKEHKDEMRYQIALEQ